MRLRNIRPDDQWVVDDTGRVVGIASGSGANRVNLATVESNDVTGMVEVPGLITSGADAPDDDDGAPNGAIYFQI